jgi:hypothetical protein
MEAVTTFVTDVASSAPLALLLDDLHAADTPSLLLLRFVARELGDAPILIVGCYRVAIDTERRMRALPWLAHARHDYGAMLLARGRGADADRAHALLDAAVTTYRELGMDTWAERAQAVRRHAGRTSADPAASPYRAYR